MATDPRRLRPSELCRLLNSSPLGEVFNKRQLYRHRTRAGLRIGHSKSVDLLRYGPNVSNRWSVRKLTCFEIELFKVARAVQREVTRIRRVLQRAGLEPKNAATPEVLP